MEDLGQQLQLEDTNWNFVKTRTLGQGAIYLSTHGDRYLRIGSDDDIRDEAEFAKNIHDMGFPVPEVLSEGAIDADTYYFTESSLGTQTFGDTFREEYRDSAAIDEGSFGQYCRVASLFLVAQLRSAPSSGEKSNLRDGVNLDNVIEENPDLSKEALEKAFAKAVARVAILPLVLTHGDLGPFNMLPGGVIDFEHKFIAPMGFDVITSPFVGRFWNFTKPDGTSQLAYDLSERQIKHYLDTIDSTASNLGLENLSSFTDDMVLLKAIWETSFEKQIAEDLGNNYRWQNKKETLRYCVNQYMVDLPIDTSTFGKHLGY
jgi:hypothetical protein